MNYLVNVLLTVASLLALAVPVFGAGETLEAMAYLAACALAVLSIIVGLSIPTGNIGNEGVSRMGVEK